MMQTAYRSLLLAENFYAILDDFTRCYLLVGDKIALLIDTGVSGGDLYGFCRTLTEQPIRVVNTHADPDHIAANGQFDSFYLHLLKKLSGNIPPCLKVSLAVALHSVFKHYVFFRLKYR